MRELAKGAGFLATAAAAILLFATFLDAKEAEAVRRAVLWAFPASLPFLLPAGVLLRHRKPWFEGFYAAGFMVRLALLGAAMAASRDRAFPAALAVVLFVLELAGIAWMGLALKRVEA